MEPKSNLIISTWSILKIMDDCVLHVIYIHYCFIIVPTLIDVLSPMPQLSLSATSPALWLE